MSVRPRLLALMASVTVLAALTAPLGAQAAKGQGPIVLKDDTGTTVTLAHPARRVVTLISSDTQIMLALGLRRRLVGVDQDSIQYMAAPYNRLVAGLPSIGNTYPTPNIEEILKARPDLILSSGAVADTAKLRSLGIPVLVLNPQNLQGIEHDIALVGEATGSTAGASRLVAAMNASAARVEALARGAKTHPSVYVEVGANPYYSVGPGSYINALLGLLDAPNAVDRTARIAYPELSSEAVVAMNPQVIVLDEPGVTAAQVAARPGWSAISAVATGRIYANVNMNALSEPGPAVITALWQLARDLYPGRSAHSRGA